ncbi:MAG: PD40 domain-containing protein [Bacteroidales bacterium]|nr:PD40 domain-containing protein [Bacteroidales bacterium]
MSMAPRYCNLKFKLLIVFTLFISVYANAQYFGRNKPLYKRFDYNVYQTPNFEIYHYFKNDSILNRISQTAEKWYWMHYQVFRDSIKKKNPLLIYPNQGDFQQTTAISGIIGIGTGGVTEALKNRVVLPVTETWAQTEHVLGHELVHAFQYNSLINSDSTSLNSVRNLPLWMVEGMAEYLSLGSVDYLTAMWMRDAVLNDYLPTLDLMTRDQNKYFPYRYGQAFWAFVGRTFGDSLINPIFKETAKRGYDWALRRYVGMDEKTFSNIWINVNKDFYKKVMKDSVDTPAGNRTIFEKNAGEINISPSVSPDGRYVAFYSEKDLFSIDLFLANAASGRIIRKLSSTVHDNEIDALNFIESAGTWSPDSKQFAFVAFSKGKNKLLIVDVFNEKLVKEFLIPGVPAFNYPTWSPNGETIVVSGLVEGVNDLYSYNLKTGEVKNLTNDIWCNVHPSWSPDGRYIVFSTDQPTEEDKKNNRKVGYYIATYDTQTGLTKVLPFFPRAENLNPMFSSNGKSIYFLSNADGFRNLYTYNLESGEIYRQTRILTGISGMTPLAPAMSLARETNEITYSYYFNGHYSIYTADTIDFSPVKMNPDSVDFTASILPPFNRAVPGIIDNYLSNMSKLSKTPIDSFKTVPFKPKFKLDYISNIGVGISTSQYGTGMQGGVEMLFSDITGGHQIYTGLALNGEIYDFGGQLSYMNQKNRVFWGLSVSHIPYSYGYQYQYVDTTSFPQPVLVDQLQYIRMFEDQIGGMAYFPLSQTQRFETSTSLARYYYRIDNYNSYYDANYNYLGQKREKADAPPGFFLAQTDLAYVFDNSSFGIASPMKGVRTRLGIDKTYGKYNFNGVLIDLRKYIYAKPFCFAMRGYYYGRFGSNSENSLYPLYIAYPWYIRGYDRASFMENTSPNNRYVTYNQLQGSQIMVTNFEIRLPFTGPERLTVLKSNFFYTELALFADAGIAWDSQNSPVLRWTPRNDTERIPVFSTGVSLRFNLFGMLVIEPFYAIPYQLGGMKSAYIGVNFLPGW